MFFLAVIVCKNNPTTNICIFPYLCIAYVRQMTCLCATMQSCVFYFNKISHFAIITNFCVWSESCKWSHFHIFTNYTILQITITNFAVFSNSWIFYIVKRINYCIITNNSIPLYDIKWVNCHIFSNHDTFVYKSIFHFCSSMIIYEKHWHIVKSRLKSNSR